MTWAPDGAKGVLGINGRGEKTGSQLLLVDLNGADRPLLDPASGSDYVWSPDSRRLAYRLNGRAYVMDVTTGKSDALPEMNFAPSSWSADGKRLAGTRVYPNQLPSTVVFNFDTRNFEELNKSGEGAGPRWLKQGNRMWIGQGGRIMIFDYLTKGAQDVLTMPMGGSNLNLPLDSGPIFYLINQFEADVFQLRQ
jgi:Tol biopolymer transport system component